MAYHLTCAAEQDIVHLYAFSEKALGTKQTEHYVDALFNVFDLINNTPFMAREYSELSPPMRIHRYESHIIVYTTKGQDVIIVRVLHMRQDWRAILT